MALDPLILGKHGGAYWSAQRIRSGSAFPLSSFITTRTAGTWYRAHNASIVSGFLEHRDLAELESMPERFWRMRAGAETCGVSMRVGLTLGF